MSAPVIMRTKNYDPSVLTFGNSTEKMVSFYYPTGNDEFTKLRIQTPKLRIPFDPEERKTKADKIFVKNISLSTDEIGNDDNKKTISKFRAKMTETDGILKSLLPENLKSKEFGSSMWQGKNIKYKPIMKISMNYKDEKCQTAVYDANDTKITDEDIKKDIIISAIIRLDGVWIANNKMGINWVAEQIKIYETESVVPKYNIRKIEDDNDSD